MQQILKGAANTWYITVNHRMVNKGNNLLVVLTQGENTKSFIPGVTQDARKDTLTFTEGAAESLEHGFIDLSSWPSGFVRYEVFEYTATDFGFAIITEGGSLLTTEGGSVIVSEGFTEISDGSKLESLEKGRAMLYESSGVFGQGTVTEYTRTETDVVYTG